MYSLDSLVSTAGKLKEGYDSVTKNPNPTPALVLEQKNISGMLNFILLILVIVFAVWFVALYLLIKNWSHIPTWAKVVGIIGLIPQVPGGPILTIIVVLASKNV